MIEEENSYILHLALTIANQYTREEIQQMLDNDNKLDGMSLNEYIMDLNCKVFEVCNPKQAAKVLDTDMRLNMALPCRISVFTENNKTKIGLIKPEEMLSALSNDKSLVDTAKQVEEKTKQMVDQAK